MTNTEIKKLYTKTKKAFEKRTGEKHTWVMNARQQRLGTATILVAAAYDYEEWLRKAEQAMADFEKRWAEREADYRKRAAEEARKNECTPGWYFGKNDYFWQEVITPDHLAKSKAEMYDGYVRHLEEVKANREKHGTQVQQLKKGHEYAKAFIASPEVQSFLEAIGGQAVVEDKLENGALLVYVRFHYTATET